MPRGVTAERGKKRKPRGKRGRDARRKGEAKPRDALFKHKFADPAHLAGELESVLAPELLAELDLSTLRLLPGSFVGGEIKSSHADLLFEFTAAEARSVRCSTCCSSTRARRRRR